MLPLICCTWILVWVSKTNGASVHQELNDSSLAASEFEIFIQEFNKSYKDEAEKSLRFAFFRENLKEIETLQRAEMGTAIYGVNAFSDMSKEEFLQRYASPPLNLEELGEKDTKDHSGILQTHQDLHQNGPPNFDWRTLNVMMPIKNQGDCHAGYVYAAIGALEALYSRMMKLPYYFADQEMIDCVNDRKGTDYDGCGGGYSGDVFEYIKDIGVVRGGLYRRTGTAGPCRKLPYVHYKLDEAYEEKAEPGRSAEPTLLSLIPTTPVTVRINMDTLQHYKSGVMNVDGSRCSKVVIKANHVLLVVGFGVERDKKGTENPYWILRNSFGVKWGDKGYAYLYRGRNVCGVGNWLNWCKVSPPPKQ